MKLDDIGFYTLSEKRAESIAKDSSAAPLSRCELILTEECNFKCAYCRGIKKGYGGSMSLDEAKRVVGEWARRGLRNVRFSGGEPTIWPGLLDLVEFTRSFRCVERVAISTNGSAAASFYEKLVKAGVDDFSVSLDACCAADADKMAGVDARFSTIADNVRFLSSIAYTTVGVVLDERNVAQLEKTVDFALSLGVHDVRIIPSAQYDERLKLKREATKPILKYRLDNVEHGRHVRGISDIDSDKCYLVLDDMVVCGGHHFPCVIYMREQGEPIGKFTNIDEVMEQRREWFERVDARGDEICRKNCLDVCIDHNNAVRQNIFCWER